MKVMKKIGALASENRVALGLSVLLGASSANAALPTVVTDAFTAMSTTITETETAAWPVITVGLVAFFLVKIVKKFANKVG